MFEGKEVLVALAGAGAGKTTFLVDKIISELQDNIPEQIAMVTFTKKGVQEFIERVNLVAGITKSSMLFFKTLHAMAFSNLKLDYTKVLTEWKRDEFIKNVKLPYALEHLDLYDTKRLGGEVDLRELDWFTPLTYKTIVLDYQELKQKEGLFDFTDCLLQYLEEGTSLPVDVAFIDEAQDLTPIQWKVCLKMFVNAKKVYIAGDDYQSIYTHAGATPKPLIALSNKYPTVKLEKSYRLSKSVYKYASLLTDFIGDKIDKDFKPSKIEEGKVEFMPDDWSIINHFIYDDFARPISVVQWYLLFRTNYHSERMTATLRGLSIPFHTALGFCISEKKLRLLRKFDNYNKLGFGSEKSRDEFQRKYSIPSFDCRITETALFDTIEEAIEMENYVDRYGIDNLWKMSKETPYILVATIHAVKGGEAENVVLFTDWTRRIHRNWYVDPDSEYRVLYVGITRSRKNLYFVDTKSTYNCMDICRTLQREVRRI